jgi:hypothetical protein
LRASLGHAGGCADCSLAPVFALTLALLRELLATALPFVGERPGAWLPEAHVVADLAAQADYAGPDELDSARPRVLAVASFDASPLPPPSVEEPAFLGWVDVNAVGGWDCGDELDLVGAAQSPTN